MTENPRAVADAIRAYEAAQYRWPEQRESLPRPEPVCGERVLQQMARARSSDFPAEPPSLGRFNCRGEYVFPQAATPAEPTLLDDLKALAFDSSSWRAAGLTLAFIAFGIGCGLILSALLIMINH